MICKAHYHIDDCLDN